MQKIKFDKWQKEILDHEGDILLLKGRRIGGTEIFSIKAVHSMMKGKRIVMVSHSEDQAKLIVMFALNYIDAAKYRNYFHMSGEKKPTQTRIIAKSGGSLIVRPVGNTGDAVRGFDGDILGVDEAPLQPKQMWAAARPIVSTNNGTIWMWGTPKGKVGYFWEQYNKIVNLNKPGRFKCWYKTTEQVLEERPICETWTEKQREGLRRILDQEKEDMSTLEYGQEYLGQFLDDLQRVFSDELLEKVSTIERGTTQGEKNYLGVDIARLGDDKSAFSIVTELSDGTFAHIETETTSKQLTTSTEQKILTMAKDWKCVKVGIDAGSGSLGVGIYDHLRETEIRHKVLALNKRAISLDDEGKSKQQLFGEDMFLNLLSMMQHEEIRILNDPNVLASLRSILFEHVHAPNQKTRLRIFATRHEDSDISESLIRAAWMAKKEKTLKLWAA